MSNKEIGLHPSALIPQAVRLFYLKQCKTDGYKSVAHGYIHEDGGFYLLNHDNKTYKNIADVEMAYNGTKLIWKQDEPVFPFGVKLEWEDISFS